jgi:hypothetical protein
VRDIWRDCKGAEQVAPLAITAIRVVESQEQVATTRLVDTLEEQHQLETLLERSKPPAPAGAERHDYLLWTPFRYPPLPRGSRFGRHSEGGIFYASLTIHAALAETAYYRFVFLAGLAEPLPSASLTTELGSFEVRIETTAGVMLDAMPFDRHRAAISNPAHYDATQALGTAMRAAGVAVFTWRSARDRGGGRNAGVFRLDAIRSRRPEQMHHWVCTTTARTVSFMRLFARNEAPLTFPRTQFLVDGRLPAPAC